MCDFEDSITILAIAACECSHSLLSIPLPLSDGPSDNLQRGCGALHQWHQIGIRAAAVLWADAGCKRSVSDFGKIAFR